MDISIVSVVRNKEMYSRCVSNNTNINGCRLTEIQNWEKNLPITVCYNSVLEKVSPEEGWIVFCHEDWEILEPIEDVVSRLDKNFIYGPIGIFVEERKKVDVMVPMGRIFQTSKKGNRRAVIRGAKQEGRVDTFDCQCVIVHSSLVCKYCLRFDENLRFDMYVEDFCVSAYENHSIESRTTSIECCHHSRGVISDSFKKALAYEREKYRFSKKRYATIVGHLNTFGKGWERPVFKWKRTLTSQFRYRVLK